MFFIVIENTIWRTTNKRELLLNQEHRKKEDQQKALLMAELSLGKDSLKLIIRSSTQIKKYLSITIKRKTPEDHRWSKTKKRRWNKGYLSAS